MDMIAVLTSWCTVGSILGESKVCMASLCRNARRWLRYRVLVQCSACDWRRRCSRWLPEPDCPTWSRPFSHTDPERRMKNSTIYLNEQGCQSPFSHHRHMFHLKSILLSPLKVWNEHFHHITWTCRRWVKVVTRTSSLLRILPRPLSLHVVMRACRTWLPAGSDARVSRSAGLSVRRLLRSSDRSLNLASDWTRREPW